MESLLQILIGNLTDLFRFVANDEKKSLAHVYLVLRELSVFSRNTMDYCLMPLRAKRIFTIYASKDVDAGDGMPYCEDYEMLPNGKLNGFATRVYVHGAIAKMFYLYDVVVFKTLKRYYQHMNKRVTIYVDGLSVFGYKNDKLRIRMMCGFPLITIFVGKLKLQEEELCNHYKLKISSPHHWIVAYVYKRSHIYDLASNEKFVVAVSQLDLCEKKTDFTKQMEEISKSMGWSVKEEGCDIPLD